MQVPTSYYLPTNKLSSIFKNTTATYKFYWFLSILDFVEKGYLIISKEDIFIQMIVRSWHPITYYNLSFGKSDILNSIIFSLNKNLKVPTTLELNALSNLLSKSIQSKDIAFLNNNVPFKFLYPWYGSISEREIENLSQNFIEDAPYALYKHQIAINPKWVEYLTQNSKILKEFCYWNLSSFLQIRNPNIPNVASKLLPELSRNALTKQRNEFWKPTFEELGSIPCIYTSNKLTLEENNFAIDHFIPYSFVAHDLIWNLLPIDKSFNSSKSNKLPELSKYFEDFSYLQKTAFDIYKKKYPNGKFLEEYATIFHHANFDTDKLKETLEPLIMIASNNGFNMLN